MKKVLSKTIKKKEEKKKSLLKNAFALYTEKGIKNTTVQDIVDRAGLAKGTFYLYFNDKYEVQDELIAIESKKLFDEALKKLDKEKTPKFEDQLIFVLDSIIDELNKNKLLLKFISKNLSWGLYHENVNKLVKSNPLDLRNLFNEGIKRENIPLKNPEVTLYMITELVSSTCFSSILKNEPLPIKEYKPYLFNEIRKMLKE